jgi:hypothetical protein
MIYVDDMFEGQGVGHLKGQWCHMWSDESDEELLEFGRKIGLKDTWMQKHNPAFHHYDLRVNKRKQALELGAQYLPLRKWIEIRKWAKKETTP